MTPLVIALAIVVALLTILVVGLLQSHAAIIKALDEAGIEFDRRRPNPSRTGGTGSTVSVPLGSTRPPFAGEQSAEPGENRARDLIGVDFEGNPMAVAVTQVPRVTLLAFLSSGCLTCHSFWEGFADPSTRAAVVPGAAVVAVTKGPDGETPAGVAKLAGPTLLTIMSSEAWDDYSVPVAPYFMLVDGTTNRVIGEGSATTFAQLGELMARAQADREIAQSRKQDGVSRRELFEAFRPPTGSEMDTQS